MHYFLGDHVLLRSLLVDSHPSKLPWCSRDFWARYVRKDTDCKRLDKAKQIRKQHLNRRHRFIFLGSKGTTGFESHILVATLLGISLHGPDEAVAMAINFSH